MMFRYWMMRALRYGMIFKSRMSKVLCRLSLDIRFLDVRTLRSFETSAFYHLGTLRLLDECKPQMHHGGNLMSRDLQSCYFNTVVFFMFFFIVNCNLIIQYKLTKCTFPKLIFEFFIPLRLLHASNPRLHRQEDVYIYSEVSYVLHASGRLLIMNHIRRTMP